MAEEQLRLGQLQLHQQRLAVGARDQVDAGIQQPAGAARHRSQHPVGDRPLRHAWPADSQVQPAVVLEPPVDTGSGPSSTAPCASRD
jgi:hypothetical protein